MMKQKMATRIRWIHKCIVSTLLSLLCVNIPFTAIAQIENYTPLSRSERAKRFGLTYIGSLTSKQLLDRVALDTFDAKIQHTSNDDIRFSGLNQYGKTWSVEIASKGDLFPSELYVADLDNNGYKDILVVSPTGGNGLAPSAHLTTLMFDATAQPIPFTADGYFSWDRAGISDIVDMNGDGKAELIYMNHDDGYWITTLYTGANGRWKRLQGRFGKRDYPLFTRFTVQPNHQAIKPVPGTNPYVPDLSNTVPQVEGKLLSYRWANVSQSEDIELVIKTRNGDQQSCKPASWYSTFAVVVDAAEGRQIASLGASEQAVKILLDDIIANKYQVDFFGQRRSNQCTPELLWARPVIGG